MRLNFRSQAGILAAPVTGGLWFPAQFDLLNNRDEPLNSYVAAMPGGRVSQITCRAVCTCDRAETFRGIMFPTGISLTPDKSRLFAVEAFSGRLIAVDRRTGARELVARLPR